MYGRTSLLIVAGSLFAGLFAGLASAATVKVFDSSDIDIQSVDFRFASNRLGSSIGYERAGAFMLSAPQTLTAFNILAKPSGESAEFAEEIFPLTVSFFGFDGGTPAIAPFASFTAMSLRFESLQVAGENTLRISGSFPAVDLEAGNYLFLVRAATRDFELIGRSMPDGSAEFGRSRSDAEWRPYAFGQAQLDFELFAGGDPTIVVPLPGSFGLLLAALSALVWGRRLAV